MPKPQPTGSAGAGATLCYMRTVTHREMRNSSGEILRAVAAGETIRVTNNGRIAALIVPPPADPIAELVDRGRARPAIAPRRFSEIVRAQSDLTTAEIIEDLRNPW